MEESIKTLGAGHPRSAHGGKTERHECRERLHQSRKRRDEFAQFGRQAGLADGRAKTVRGDDQTHDVGERITGPVEKVFDAFPCLRRGGHQRHQNPGQHRQPDQSAAVSRVTDSILWQDHPLVRHVEQLIRLRQSGREQQAQGDQRDDGLDEIDPFRPGGFVGNLVTRWRRPTATIQPGCERPKQKS